MLQKVALDPLGRSYHDSSACHLDLVQWATDPIWSNIADLAARELLLQSDASYLVEQLDEGDFKALLLNGRQVIDQIQRLGLVDLQVVGRVGFGHGDRQGQLVRGQRGNTTVLGWSINLQTRGVVAANRAEVANWLHALTPALGLTARPAASAEPTYLVADTTGGTMLAWNGDARLIQGVEFAVDGNSTDSEATAAALATVARPWTALGWAELLAEYRRWRIEHFDVFDTLKAARAETYRREEKARAVWAEERKADQAVQRDAEAWLAAEPSRVVAPQLPAANPVRPNTNPNNWESVDSRWDGWVQFNLTHPTEAEMLALGQPVPLANWITLRSLQQPSAAGTRPHRYLAWTATDPACWACQGDPSDDLHADWRPSPEEEHPQVLDLGDRVDFSLEAGVCFNTANEEGRWLRARYHALRKALEVDADLLATRAGYAAADEGKYAGDMLPILFSSICDSLLAVKRTNSVAGALEGPQAWVEVLADHF